MADSSDSIAKTERFSSPVETVRQGIANFSESKTSPLSSDSQLQAGSALRNAPDGFEFLEQIGSGSMGVVYRALDKKLQRDLAIKVLRDHRSDEQAAIRFRAEAQITGQLEHPGIPAVHELGTFTDGQPFLAMRLIKGQTLQELLMQRAELNEGRGRFVAVFEQICQAVGFAHAHGVIHRDLKPHNVMVGAFGEVQVMDWGLAKRLRPRVAGQKPAEPSIPLDAESQIATWTSFSKLEPTETGTQAGAVLGTPAFLSPEQASGDLDRVDEQSDVFGLGAILCVILTGHAPYQGSDVRSVWQKAARGDLANVLNALEGCDANSDLVLLCKRCLSVKKEDRPTNGSAVADEVARIRQAAEERARTAELDREKTNVRISEQQKQRNQLLAASAVVAAVLCIGIAGTSIGLMRANQATHAERQAKIDAQTSKEIAVQEARDKSLAQLNEEKLRQKAEQAAIAERIAKEQAERRLKQIENGNEILTSIFQDLDIRSIRQAGEPLERVLAKRLIYAAHRIDAESLGDPIQVADLQCNLALPLLNLEFGKEAVELFNKALATYRKLLSATDPKLLECMGHLAMAYQEADQISKAIPLYEEAYRLSVQTMGAEDVRTLGAMNNLAEGLRAAGKIDKALPLWEKLAKISRGKLGQQHPNTMRVVGNLGTTYLMLGRTAEALPLQEEVLRANRSQLGEDHVDTLTSSNNLAGTYFALGQLEKSIALQEETVRHCRTKLGVNHGLTQNSIASLAFAYKKSNQVAKAIPLLEESYQLRLANKGSQHSATLESMSSLASGYQSAKSFDKALQLFERILAIANPILGETNALTLETRVNHAECLREAGQLSNAIVILEDVLAKNEKLLGNENPTTLQTMQKLARAYDVAGRGEQAITLYALAIKGMEKKDCLHLEGYGALSNLVVLYEAKNQFDLAEPLRRKWMADVQKRSGTNSINYTMLLIGTGYNLQQQKKYDAAAQMLRECLEIRKRNSPDDWRTFSAGSVLGGILTDQKKYAEAESHLTTAYQGLKQRQASVRPDWMYDQLKRCIERQINNYEAWGKPDQAAKWRTELKSLPPETTVRPKNP